MIVQGDETDQQGEMLAHIENIDETGTDFETNTVCHTFGLFPCTTKQICAQNETP